MKIWAQIGKAASSGLPIPQPPCEPPLQHLTFVSDAAGRRPPGSTDSTGAASIGIQNNTTWFGLQILWPPQLTWLVQSNTAVYEMIGILLPVLCIPQLLLHQHMVLYVDNEAIVWSWPKRRMKNDVVASVLLRVLHILEAFLSCKIHILHLPRTSNPAARLTDNLSRSSTTSETDLCHLTHQPEHLPTPFLTWLQNPTEDWQLGTKIVELLINKKIQ